MPSWTKIKSGSFLAEANFFGRKVYAGITTGLVAPCPVGFLTTWGGLLPYRTLSMVATSPVLIPEQIIDCFSQCLIREPKAFFEHSNPFVQVVGEAAPGEPADGEPDVVDWPAGVS